MSSLPRLSLALALLSCASAAIAQGQAPAATDPSLLPYASTENSVRLPDGRTLHLVCMGQGSPVVILAAGGDAWSIFWNTVQPEVAAQTRVCSWDRAALGLSSASPMPPTVDNTVSDLEAALKVAGIAGPYVIVGHSIGGYDSLLFADRHPSDVVGMVLVDPSPAGDPSAPPDVELPAITALMSSDPPFVGLLQRCAAGFRAGTVRPGRPDPDGCLSPPPPPANYPQELRDALTAARAGATPEATATAMDNIAFYASSKLLEQDSRIAFKPDRNYGSMPLVVLSAGEDGASPGNPVEINAELPLLLASKQRAHARLAALSTHGVQRIVTGSDHDIPHRQPQTVIDAIGEVVTAARAASAAR